MNESAPELVRRRLADGAGLLEAIAGDEDCVASIAAVAEELAAALGRGNKVLLFGNGGSAADAVHLAAEFVGRYLVERRPLPALALVANPSAVTAIGNDYGFEQVFSRQVAALGKPGDVAIGLTTSGRSENVRRGLEAAAEAGMTTVAMTGKDPGPVGAAAERTIAIPSSETPRVQEWHGIAGHILCEWAEARLAETD